MSKIERIHHKANAIHYNIFYRDTSPHFSGFTSGGDGFQFCAAKLLLYFELCKKNEKNRKKIITSRAETDRTVFGCLTINEKQHDGLTVLTV